MGYNLRFHNGDATTTIAKVMYSTLVDAPVTLVTSSGVAVDSGRTDRHGAGDYIGTGYFTISGLSPNADVPYVISQGAESYDGSTRTSVANQTTPFSVVVLTCHDFVDRGVSIYGALKQVVLDYAATFPVIRGFHIDDVTYPDGIKVTNALNLLNSTNYPQLSGLVRDYANAWAVWHGHEPTYSTFQEPDFQWCLRKMVWNMSGGDHMSENNHCRGQIGNPDYNGCNRGPGATVPNLEENSITAWHAFIGDGNPPTLGSGTDLHWGVEIGPIRFASADTIKYGVPFDGADTTQDLHGAAQLAAIRAYLNVPDVPFKTMMLETGYSQVGQPWREWHTTECNAWKAQLDADANMNGTNGWFFGLHGDYHACIAHKYDTFWAFDPGTTGTSQAVSHTTTPLAWSGKRAQFTGVNNGGATGSMRFGAFLHLIVHADETPQRLEIRAVNEAGDEMWRYETDAVPLNANQWRLVTDRDVSVE